MMGGTDEHWGATPRGRRALRSYVHRTEGGSPRREHGFTLIEVVVTIAIVALVAAAIATVIIAVFRNNGGAATAATASRDEQLVGTYFTRDIQSATAVDPSGRSMGCLGDGDWRVDGVVEITRPDALIDYYTAPANGTTILYRRSCGRDTVTATDPLVRAVGAGTIPTAACAPACLGAGVSVTMTVQVATQPDPYMVTADVRTTLSPPTHHEGGH